MWKWFLRRWSISGCVGVFSTGLGVRADWDSMPNMSAVTQLAIWLTPHIALGAAIFAGGVLITAGVS